MSSNYVPDRGDIAWLNFTPQTGHESRRVGRKRPALVLSSKNYNQKVGLAVFCPVTDQKKGYPFEVEIPSNSMITGVILSDQIKNLDWHARQARYAMKVPNSVLQECLQKIKALLQL